MFSIYVLLLRNEPLMKPVGITDSLIDIRRDNSKKRAIECEPKAATIPRTVALPQLGVLFEAISYRMTFRIYSANVVSTFNSWIYFFISLHLQIHFCCSTRGKRFQSNVCHGTCTDRSGSSVWCRPTRPDIRFCALRSTQYTMPSPIRASYRWALRSLASKFRRTSVDIWRIDLSVEKKKTKLNIWWANGSTNDLSSPCPMAGFSCIPDNRWNVLFHFRLLYDKSRPNCAVRRLCCSWFHAGKRVRIQNCRLCPLLANTV